MAFPEGVVPQKAFTNSLQRPPFAQGNEQAVKHGVNSARKVDPLAAEVLERTYESAPYLQAPEYQATVMAWARLEAQLILGTKWLDEHGLTDENGRTRDLVTVMLRTEDRAQKLREQLGLTPQSRAALEQGVAEAQGSWLDTLRKQKEAP